MDFKNTEILFEKASGALPRLQKAAHALEEKDRVLSIHYYQNESGNHKSDTELLYEADQRFDKIRRLLHFWRACENAKTRFYHRDALL
jgi:hypothetical protein